MTQSLLKKAMNTTTETGVAVVQPPVPPEPQRPLGVPPPLQRGSCDALTDALIALTAQVRRSAVLQERFGSRNSDL